MSDAPDPGPSFADTVTTLASHHPQLATVLAEAHIRRSQAVGRLAGTERFRGIDELLVWLDALTTAFRAEGRLERLAFLGTRVIADVETALEATLSGYSAVAFDAMRDALEIEYLLRDFALDPQRIDTWLSGDERTLKREFKAVDVRKRLQAAGAVNFGDNAESLDYKGHSQMLHLRPDTPGPLDILPVRGRSRDTVFERDMGLWEIFNHGRSLRGAFQALTRATCPGTAADQEAQRSLSAFEEALDYVHAAQQHFMALSDAQQALQQGKHGQALAILVHALAKAGFLDTALFAHERRADLHRELTQIATKTDGRARTLAPIAIALMNGQDQNASDQD